MRRAQHTRTDAAILNCERVLRRKNTGPWRRLYKNIKIKCRFFFPLKIDKTNKCMFLSKKTNKKTKAKLAFEVIFVLHLKYDNTKSQNMIPSLI